MVAVRMPWLMNILNMGMSTALVMSVVTIKGVMIVLWLGRTTVRRNEVGECLLSYVLDVVLLRILQRVLIGLILEMGNHQFVLSVKLELGTVSFHELIGHPWEWEKFSGCRNLTTEI